MRKREEVFGRQAPWLLRQRFGQDAPVKIEWLQVEQLANGRRDVHVVNVADAGPLLDARSRHYQFSRLPAYTPRTNPVIYDQVTGSGFFNPDTSLTKSFRIRERCAAHLRLDSFNTPNRMTWNDPSNNISSTLFEKSSDQFNLNGAGVGRTTQLGLRVPF